MFVVGAILVIVCIYLLKKLWSSFNFNYWEKRGITGPKPLPLIGNTLDMFLGKKTLGEIYTQVYRKYENQPWVGFYNIQKPELIIRHPDLVREVFVKEFNSFPNNHFELNPKADPLLAQNPFFLRDQQWKETRTQLVPAFTPAQVKTVLPKIYTVAKRLTDYIKNNNSKPFELKELATRFTTDNVFSIIYSMDAKSFNEEDAFYWKQIRKLFTPSVTAAIKGIFFLAVPWLWNLLNIGFFPKSLTKLLIDLSNDTLKQRKEKDVRKGDILDIYAELKGRKTGRSFSELEVASHAAGFIIDGLETTATALSFALYELSINPDIQEKLYEEIKSIIESHGEEIPYVVQEMKYLDNVCSESLRLHPPILFLNRMCSRNHILKNPENEKEEVTVEKGMILSIPNYGIQLDAKYFPKPEVFDPDRFEDNRSNIIRGSYLPFGDGPRVCLGQKFGLIQIKLGIISILKDFKLEPNSKTKSPLEIDPFYFLKTAKGGIWANMKRREVDIETK